MLTMILLGLSFSAPIGPVTAEAIRRGLIGGFLPAFTVKFGAVVGDFLFLLAAFYGLSALASDKVVLSVLGLTGAIILLFIGIKNIIKAINYTHRKVSDELKDPVGAGNNTCDTSDVSVAGSVNVDLKNSFKVGFIIAITNPFALAFWLTIFTSGQFNWGDDQVTIVLNVGYFFAGIMLWDLILATMLEGGKRIVNDLTIRLITAAAGLYLSWVGLTFAIQSVSRLLG